MSSPYIKSLIWLVTLGGIGYGLLQVAKPSEEKLQKIKAVGEGNQTDEEKRKALLMQSFKKAATDSPIYLKKKEV